MSMKLMVKTCILFAIAASFFSCNYSLSGYEIQGETVRVNYFENQAPIQSAELSQIFTNKLETRIIRETSLQLIREQADLEFSGAIIGYSLSPAAVSGEETTEQTQLTVRVNVEYTNAVNDEKNFNQSFSGSETFDANQDLAAVESDLLDEISEQIIQAIFNKAFIDW